MPLRPLALFLALTLLPHSLLAQTAAPAATETPTAPPAKTGATAATPAGGVPLAEIRRFVAIYNAIRNGFVVPLDDRTLMQSALRGLLLDLDPHSVYLDAEAASELAEDTTGRYEGVGVQLQQEPGPLLRVVTTLEGGPAERAGLLSGDVITAIDGKPIDHQTGSAPLRGAAGTTVTVTVTRKNRATPFDVTLTREYVRLTSVRQRMLEPGWGYIRLAHFHAGSAEEFRQAAETLKTEANGRLHGAVLDLRGNPGGLFNAAIDIADALLDGGTIVSTRGRAGVTAENRFSARPGELLPGTALVVLVDAGSASAAEVLAAALADNRRARIVGSRTFGKGSVQALLPLDNGDAIRLTTSLYYTPNGRSIQGEGILPDVWLHETPPGQGAARPAASPSEASLPRHLVGEEEGRVPRAGENAGESLPGEAPVRAALAELKKAARPSAPPASGRR